MMVVRDEPNGPWKSLADAIGTTSEPIDVVEDSDISTAGIKRRRSPLATDVPEAKRARGSTSVFTSTSTQCLAPPPNLIAQKVLADRSFASDLSLGAGDVFLTEGFRGRWCRCTSVSSRFKHCLHCVDL